MSNDHPSLPHFVVIGAQKSGTTTLYEDLRQHPSVGLCEKESSGLLRDLSTPQQARKYASGFPNSPALSRLGDVSTTYSMLPEHPNVASQAALIRPDMRIVYILRNPIDRTISHHHHAYALEQVGQDIDEAIRDFPPLIDYSRYATQLRPWIERFTADRILVIRFEDYMNDRQAGFDMLTDFLELPRHALMNLEVHNSSERKVVAKGRWRSVASNPLYRRAIRPIVRESTRRRIASALLPSAPARPTGPSMATLRKLEAELSPEVERLSEYIQRPPLWDLSATVERYT